MTTLAKTESGQWQLGRDDTYVLIGMETTEGVMLVESTYTAKRNISDAITIRTDQEAANVITFLRMAFPLRGEEGT